MQVVVSVTIMLVDHFVATLMQKAVSAAENMGDNFYCNYAVGSLCCKLYKWYFLQCFMHMTVSIVIMKMTVSVTAM